MAVVNKKLVHIYLRPEVINELRAISDDRRVSVGELVRQIIDGFLLNNPKERDPLLDIIGIVDSGPTDLSENLDQYLVNFMEEESRSWRAKSSSTQAPGLQ